jgi:hypothetical protein
MPSAPVAIIASRTVSASVPPSWCEVACGFGVGRSHAEPFQRSRTSVSVDQLYWSTTGDAGRAVERLEVNFAARSSASMAR